MKLIIKDRTNYARALVKRYEDVKTKVDDMLFTDKVEMRSAAFTTDMWTSRVGDSFMSLTLHYVDTAFKIKRWTLECAAVEGSHTGEKIRDELDPMIEGLNLPLPCETLAVHDNGANMVKAITLSTAVNTDVRCVCHTLQLAIKDAFKSGGAGSMETALEKCKKLATVTHSSSQSLQALKAECATLGIAFKKLVTPVPTRWNSEAACMSSCLYLKRAIISLAGHDDTFHARAPSPLEWATIEGGATLLQELKDMSEVWSGDQYPTAIEVVPRLFNVAGRRGGVIKGFLATTAQNR